MSEEIDDICSVCLLKINEPLNEAILKATQNELDTLKQGIKEAVEEIEAERNIALKYCCGHSEADGAADAYNTALDILKKHGIEV